MVTFSSFLQILATGALGSPLTLPSLGFLGSQKSLSSETIVRSFVPRAIRRISLSMVSLPNPRSLNRLAIGEGGFCRFLIRTILSSSPHWATKVLISGPQVFSHSSTSPRAESIAKVIFLSLNHLSNGFSRTDAGLLCLLLAFGGLNR